MGGKRDLALCFETIRIYKIPLIVYSSKIQARFTGFEAKWCLGKFTVNTLLFDTRLFTNTCEQNTF